MENDVRYINKDGNELKYMTEGACGFDFYASDDVVFKPMEFKIIETNTVIEVPKGYVLLTMPRSSTYKNYKLIQVNGVGVIDNDYSGDNDTIKWPYLNISPEIIHVKKGERIGQGVLVPVLYANLVKVDTMGNQDRGGFGTTGKV